MFSWPVIGPLVQLLVQALPATITSIVTSKSNQEIEATKASVQVIQATEADVGVRLCRDLLMFPVCVLTAVYGWDILVGHEYPSLVWQLKGWYDGALSGLPYAVFAFLLGHTALSLWRK